MYIKEEDLKKKKVLWNIFSTGYDLGDGLIAKKYNYDDYILRDLCIKKVLVAKNYQWINGLVVPIDCLEQENGITGCIMDKIDGIPFDEYYIKTDEGPSLQEIVDYIVKVEKVLMTCHQEEIFFPDLASGNVLYNTQTKDVNIIDYDGAQIGDLVSTEISSLISIPNGELLRSKKYKNDLKYNKNIDILTLIIRFFYYATKIDIGKNLMVGFSLDDIFKLVNIQDERLKELIRIAFDRHKENEYIGESLEEVSKNYTITKKVLGKPRTFVRR